MKQEVSDDPRRARVAEGRNGPAPPTGPRSWQETQSPGASAVRLSGLGGEGPACPGSSREATGSDVTPPPPPRAGPASPTAAALVFLARQTVRACCTYTRTTTLGGCPPMGQVATFGVSR